MSCLIVYSFNAEKPVYWANLMFFLNNGVPTIAKGNKLIFVLGFLENDDQEKQFKELCLAPPRNSDISIEIVTKPKERFHYAAWGLAVHRENNKKYDYYIFMDCTSRGPFLPRWIPHDDIPWHDHITSHLSESIKIVSTTLSPEGHVEHAVWATDWVGVNILTTNKILQPDLHVQDIPLVSLHWKMATTHIFTSKQYQIYTFQVGLQARCNPIEAMFVPCENENVNIRNYTEFISHSVSSPIRVYILYYSDVSHMIARQLEHFPWARLVRVGQSSKFMESQFLRTLSDLEPEWRDAPYVGMCGYGIMLKQTGVPRRSMETLVDESKNADFISFYGALKEPLIENTCKFHPEFASIWTALLKKLEITDCSDIPLWFPCNSWMAKPQWMKQYLEMALKVMHWLETDVELMGLCDQDTHYQGKLSAESRLQLFGKPYYTYYPFVMERLPALFLWMNREKQSFYITDLGYASFFKNC